MVYNPANEFDKKRAIERFKSFLDKQQPFELKRMAVSKSSNQNRYFHLIVGWFAWEYGEDFEYVKQEMIKKQICPEIFKTERANTRTGEVREAWKSFSTISKDDTTYVINKFRDYSSKEAGIYLPSSDDLAILQEIEVQLKNNQQYL